MEYQGTDGDDTLDQKQLGLPDWSTIYGLKGNDRITVANGGAHGGPGNDTLIGTHWLSAAGYGQSPAGIEVNLATGVVKDGWGGVDTLINIHTVQSTGFDDLLIGSSDDDTFWAMGGSDTIKGGGGRDTVIYYGVKRSDAVITYDAANDTFRVELVNGGGKRETSVLSGIATLLFTPAGPGHPDEERVSRGDFGVFPRIASPALAVHAPEYVGWVYPGDLNGDGHRDVLVYPAIGTGGPEVPFRALLGDGKGGMRDVGAEWFGATAPLPGVGGGRMVVVDLNRDGRDDIFHVDSGDDAPPFPGGKSKYFLSTAGGGYIDMGSTLQQTQTFNHGGSAGDVNGDGWPDVLVNSIGYDVGDRLFLNDGTGKLVARQDLLPVRKHANGHFFTHTFSGILDLNADGHLDLVLGRWDGASGAPYSGLLLNPGNGDFSKVTAIDLPLSAIERELVMDVEAIDLNGDALADLALSLTDGGEGSYQTPYVQLLVNLGSGQFRDETQLRLPQAVSATSGWYGSIEIVDLNRDGYSDILAVATSGAWQPSIVFMNDGTGRFGAAWEGPAGSTAAPVDVDSDGALELLTFPRSGTSYSIHENTLAQGNVYRANFGGETLLGSAGADVFSVRDGANRLDGAGGLDTLSYAMPRAAVQIARGTDGLLTVQRAPRQVDTLKNIERIHFSDQALALDLNGHAGTVARILGAVFGPASVRNAEYVGIGLKYLDGMKPDALMNLALNLVLGTGYSVGAEVSLLFNNLVGRAPSDTEAAHWVGEVAAGRYTPLSLAWLAADYELNLQNIQLVGLAENGLPFVPAG